MFRFLCNIAFILYYYNLQQMIIADKSSKMRLGIARSRFADFIKSKGRKSVAKKRFSKASLRKTMDDDDIANSTLLNYSTKASQIQLTEVNEPAWMSDYRKCCMLLFEVDGIMEDVKEEKAKKMTAINEQKHKRVIEGYYAECAKVYNEQTKKIQQCQKIFKGIQKFVDVSSSAQQKKIFANTLMSLAMKTREKAKQIRHAQQQDLRERQQLRSYEINNLDAQNLMNKDIDENGDGEWVSEQGFQALQQQLNNQRNQQILKIVASIHSLNTIYKQLQEVVIQQGSLLDRIDENINTAAFNVKQANQHLAKAQEHQRSPFANRVMLILILLIVLFTLILAFR